MECHNCTVRQRQFYCTTCIKTHLRDFHSQHTHYQNDLKLVIAGASNSLANVVEPARMARARVADIQGRVEELVGGLSGVRRDCERKRDRIRKLREDLAQRRRTLGAARMILRPPTSTSTSNTPTPTQAPTTESNTNTGGSNNVFSPLLAYATGLVTPLTSGTTNPFLSTPTYPPPPGSPDLGTPASPTIAHLQQQHPYPFHHHHQHPASPHYPASPHSHYHSHYHSHAALSLLSTPIPPSPAFQSLSQTLVRARVGLIQELVEVFNIVEVGGRPNIGGRQGTRGEWTIGPGLVLPVPGDIRRYPPDHINAVLTLTLHFVNLLSFYLGVKLPFEVVWSGGKVGLGVPWIGAIKGGPVSGEGGGSASWARWYTKHPLHLSNSPSTASPGLSSPSSLSTPSSSSNSHHPSSPHTDTSTPSRTKIPQAQPLQSPSSSSSSKSTPTAGEKSTRRTSLMGLAAGVVGFATGGRVRSVSGSSASSRGVSAGYASSPLRPSDEHGGAGERRSGDGGTRLEGEEEEEDEESRRAMEESMIAAMPLPGPSPVVGRRASLSVNTAVAAVGGARGSGQPATPTRHSNTTSHPTPSTPTSSHPTSSTTPTSTPTSTTPSSAATSSTTSTQNSTSTTSPTPSFTTALAMLIYNVLYLGHTQGVEIPLHACGEVLSNLWRVCCAGEGGRWSHETGGYSGYSGVYSGIGMGLGTALGTGGLGPGGVGGGGVGGGGVGGGGVGGGGVGGGGMGGGAGEPTTPTTATSSTTTATTTATLHRLPPPTPPSFTTEFGQVLQVISTAHRERSKGVRVVSGRKGRSSFRDDSTSSRGKAASGGGGVGGTSSGVGKELGGLGGTSGAGRGGGVRDGIEEEEEEEFDVVETEPWGGGGGHTSPKQGRKSDRDEWDLVEEDEF